MWYLGQIRNRYEKFSELNAELLAISPSKFDYTQKYKKKHKLTFPMLVDEESVVTMKYDLWNRWELIRNKVPHPATYIIDKQGIVRFAEVRQNYLSRTKLKTIFEVLKTLE